MGDVDRARARTEAVASHLAPSAPPPEWNAAVADLEATFPASQLSLDLETRNQHGQSFGSLLPPAPPAAIVHALSTEDVVRVVRICTRRGIVLIPTGGRTALEGQFQATCCNPPPEERWNGRGSSDEEAQVEEKKRARASSRPTVHVSLSRMQDIRLYEQDFQAVVQPGVGWKSLNEHLASRGIKLFFPVSDRAQITVSFRSRATRTLRASNARRWTRRREANLAEWRVSRAAVPMLVRSSKTHNHRGPQLTYATVGRTSSRVRNAPCGMDSVAHRRTDGRHCDPDEGPQPRP